MIAFTWKEAQDLRLRRTSDHLRIKSYRGKDASANADASFFVLESFDSGAEKKSFMNLLEKKYCI